MTSFSVLIGWSSIATMMSPPMGTRMRWITTSRCAPRRPALAAGLSGRTSSSRTPSSTLMFAPAAFRTRTLSGVSPIMLIPSHGWGNLPWAISSGTTLRTVFDETANPMPADDSLVLMICEFTPITRPARSSSGPPEFPGLIGASV